MEAKDLVGKLAIRTGPVAYGDWSYTTSPIKIVKVTDAHIVVSYEGTDEGKIFDTDLFILNTHWLDDKWTDYEKLIKGCKKSNVAKWVGKLKPKEE